MSRRGRNSITGHMQATICRAYEEGGGSAGTSVRVPESQEGACESLKSPIALAIYILFLFFHFLGIFNWNSQFWEKSQSVPGPKAVLFRLAKFILEALTIRREYLDMIKTGNGLFRPIGLPVENNTDL